MKKLIVIPTYNEKENIIELIKVIHMISPDSHVLVVDDGSPDQTGPMVAEVAKRDQRIHLLQRQAKEGLGTAYVQGFKWGLTHEYDFISEMDGDWSHPPRFLTPMYQAADKADFVIGSRYVKGGGSVNWGAGRKLISRFGSLYSRMILGVGIHDFTGGFNGWHARVLKALNLDSVASDGYSFQIEIKYRAVKAGFRFVEFPIIFEERRLGQSKMSSAIVREAMWRVWSLRFSSVKSATAVAPTK